MLKTRTRVLLHVPLLELGGTERKIERLARGLDRARFEPVVAWSDGWGPVGDVLEQAGIQVCRLYPRSEEAWTQELRRIGPDIFHSFSNKQDAIDVLAAKAANVPIVITTRVNMRSWDTQLRARDWEIVRNRFTDRITTVSLAVAEVCSKAEGVPLEEITVIHNGVGIPERYDEPGIPHPVRVIGCVGSYRPEKGHALLLRAFRRVLDEYPQCRLVCRGVDSYGLKAGLHELAVELGIGRNVDLLPETTDVSAVYRGFDVYVQPSFEEGFSNAILEAMAHSLPVVATSVGGTPEVIDGLTGILVRPGDEAGLSQAILTLLRDPSRSRGFGRAARARVARRFSLADMVQAHEHLYEELCPRPGSVPSRSTDGRLRVLIHVDYLWSGGLEKKVGHLATGLDRRRFDPIVSWSEKWGPVGERLAHAGVPVAPLSLMHPTAMERIRELSPDIFHSFSCGRNGADVRAAREAGVPVIITNRGAMRAWTGGDTVQDWELERNRSTARIVACSQAVADRTASIEGVPSGQLAVVHNGVAIPRPAALSTCLRQELNLAESTELIGFAATYCPVKGHDSLLQAFRQVVDRRPDTHLVCFGEDLDDTRIRLDALAAHLGLSSQVSLLDSREDVDSIYRQLAVYVHPSLSEGFSNAILEAMSHSLAVVATAVGGTPEVVMDGITGLLVPAADSPALARALVTLLESPELRRSLGQAGFDRIIQSFSIRRMVEGYQEIYESAWAERIPCAARSIASQALPRT